MKIFFSVGEPSGDLHGANLIRELRERRGDLEFVGFGGPRMAAAGCTLLEDMTKLAVMWFLRALLNIHHFVYQLIRADRYFRRERPDVVVLIDYPGFNWWVARRAKRRGIPVIYYGAPQLWAWAAWRVKKVRRYVDHVLCKLPFEETWFRQRGCRATYVGHPYFDELHRQLLDPQFLRQQSRDDKPLITILPGSRMQEVANNLPSFLQTARTILGQMPESRFAIAAFNERQAAVAREQVKTARLPIEVFVGRTAELIHLASCCLACSGSVCLELLYREKPAVILYRISSVAYLGQQLLRTVRYISLVNLLASKDPFVPILQPVYDPDQPATEAVPFPEYLTDGDVSSRMAEHVLRWMRDSEERGLRVEQLQALKQRFARPGASDVAASLILQTLTQPHRGLPAAA